MDASRPILLAVVSDIHCGSTVAVCPDEGVRLDDGGRYTPSRAQQWLWANWLQYWTMVKDLSANRNADLWCVFNGDLFEGGAHHGTTQIISSNPEAQAYLADRVFGVPRSLGPAHTFILRGTEEHVGPSGASEEAFARFIHAEKNPTTDRWSWWQLRLKPHGLLIECQHHGRMGQRPWTESNVVNLLAAQIFYEHARRDREYPRIAIRSHRHRFADSGTAHPVRVIQTPAWQLKTAYAHRVVPESIADVGGIAILIEPNGHYEITPILFEPAEDPVWTA